MDAEEKKRDSFVFYRSFHEAIESLEDTEEKIKIYDAIVKYALDGTLPELTGVGKMAFTLIRPQLDANYQRYLNGSKGKEYGIRGKEYGKLGGRPKKEKTPQKPPINPPKNPPNVNDNENDNENENVNDEKPATYTSRFTHGEYKNILLSESELEKLNNKYSTETVQKTIERMSTYLEESGKTYNNYYLKLSKWIEEDQEKKRDNAEQLHMGYYQNVLLTSEELADLRSDHGLEFIQSYINKLSEAIKQNPEKFKDTKYQNHYEVIKKWIQANKEAKHYER